MEMGTVKWFNNAKGFGFICPEGGGEDIFAHYSTIQMDGYRTLKAGQSVRFDVHQGQKAITPVLSCPLKQKRLHSSLIHCVHPAGKMPARSAGIFIFGLFPRQRIHRIQPRGVSCRQPAKQNAGKGGAQKRGEDRHR